MVKQLTFLKTFAALNFLHHINTKNLQYNTNSLIVSLTINNHS